MISAILRAISFGQQGVANWIYLANWMLLN